jgi:hypothetical protein
MRTESSVLGQKGWQPFSSRQGPSSREWWNWEGMSCGMEGLPGKKGQVGTNSSQDVLAAFFPLARSSQSM